MKVIICRVGKLAEVAEIDGSLESMQEIVDGYIEPFYPFDDEIALIVNGEGKINGMKPNRSVKVDGEIVDVCFGDFLIVGSRAYDEDFSSLTDDEISKYLEMFMLPEDVFKFAGQIIAMPYEPDEE